MAPDLTDRQRRILARLVSEYIEQGEPVSSARLAGDGELGVSSATVRNIFARLEEMGLVVQPYTSAGRIPTDSGYRLYVDGLLGARKRGRPRPSVEARLRQSATVSDLLDAASQELSRASHHIGFALTPASPAFRLKHIDFVALEGTRVMMIVEATSGEITQSVVETGERHTSTVLTRAANYINSEFTGLTLQEARTAIAARMREERQLYDALMARALRLARTGLSEITPEQTVRVQGASLLLDDLIGPSLDRDATLEALRALFRMIEEKHRLIELLTECLAPSGLTIVIGSEHLAPDLQPFSLVASSFRDGPRTGTIGVIGPTRMRYQRAISVVDGLSTVVTRLLEGQQKPAS